MSLLDFIFELTTTYIAITPHWRALSFWILYWLYIYLRGETNIPVLQGRYICISSFCKYNSKYLQDPRKSQVRQG